MAKSAIITKGEGPQGPVGPQGPEGPQGPAGQDGADGQGIVLIGDRTVAEMNADDGSTRAPGDSFTMLDAGEITSGSQPVTVIIGDMVSWALDGHWINLGQSSQGPQGPAGPAGADGEAVLNGAADPLAGDGADGDFWINTTTNTIFGPKTAGAWPTPGVSLVGPQGTQGAKGDKGDTGATGAEGPQGPKGDTGDTGPQGPAGDAAWVVGMIMPFAGTTAPTGWAICDGTNGTPDLRGRTIFGADGNTFPYDGVGGALPAATNTGAGGDHNHAITVDAGGAHGHSLTIEGAGNHFHVGSLAEGSISYESVTPGGLPVADHQHGHGLLIAADGAHGHAGTAANAAAHSHTASNAAAPTHTHSVPAGTLPPYHVLNYIMYTG